MTDSPEPSGTPELRYLEAFLIERNGNVRFVLRHEMAVPFSSPDFQWSKDSQFVEVRLAGFDEERATKQDPPALKWYFSYNVATRELVSRIPPTEYDSFQKPSGIYLGGELFIKSEVKRFTVPDR